MRILFTFMILISLPLQAAAMVFEWPEEIRVEPCCCQVETDCSSCPDDSGTGDCGCDCDNCPCNQQQRGGPQPLNLWDANPVKLHQTVDLLSDLESPSWNFRSDSPPSPPPRLR